MALKQRDRGAFEAMLARDPSARVGLALYEEQKEAHEAEVVHGAATLQRVLQPQWTGAERRPGRAGDTGSPLWRRCRRTLSSD